MKKYLLALLALALTSNVAFALDGERPRRPGILDRQIERIGNILEDETVDMSDERRAYLSARLDILLVQQEFREAVKAAMQELGEDATREQRRAAMEGVREDFADKLDVLKDKRRAFMDKRRKRQAEEGE